VVETKVYGGGEGRGEEKNGGNLEGGGMLRNSGGRGVYGE